MERRSMDQTCGTKPNDTHDVRGPHFHGLMRCALVIGMAFLLMGVGCGEGGPNRNAIKGAVHLDGKPLGTF